MLNSYISISRNKLFVYSSIFILILLIFVHVLYFEIFSRNVIKNDFSAKQFHHIQKYSVQYEWSRMEMGVHCPF